MLENHNVYYLNRSIIFALLVSVIFPIFLELLLTPFLGPGLSINHDPDVIWLIVLFASNCLAPAALAMIFSERLRKLNKGYDFYINLCAVVITVYAIALSVICSLGLRGYVTNFSLDTFFEDYFPLGNFYLNILCVISLFIICRLRR
ncbi:hypothetical protein HG263_03985 [Pseudoalteromonas sp. JBTF-M23]|uniref:Uncharacterized protein n=1 Tax=Pseudoalteromonas caenipelagi TaxID=2726988 RepID=A0A849VCM2_9GAMM|nr:hypothetical protein [Pseudoalteromonas caenipelagi]NOU49694.1 hypothetical protein [Pseudoalteromonas caenipelagi]